MPPSNPATSRELPPSPATETEIKLGHYLYLHCRYTAQALKIKGGCWKCP